MDKKDILKVLRKNWWIIALFLIFIFSYQIRAFNLEPDKILGYDPTFQYRFTKYFIDWGHLPAWDELTYYVGRSVDASFVAPMLHYLTAMLFMLFNPLFGFSIMTTASYAAAIYGAALVIPAFLIGRELSNKYGGLLAAILIGTAPQIMIRTFGGSYDTDQIALFFIIMTLYLGYYAIRKRTPASIALAILGFSAFMLSWGTWAYTLLIVIGFVIINFLIEWFIGNKKWLIETEKASMMPNMRKRYSLAIKNLKSNAIVILIIFIVVEIIALVTKGHNFIFGCLVGEECSAIKVIGFATNPYEKIVNISIAELQSFDIFNLGGWIATTGNFIIGEGTLDIITFIAFFFFMLFGLAYTLGKRKSRLASFLLTLFLIGIYTTFRGVRFTEFTSALFLIIIAAGFGIFLEYGKRDKMLKVLAFGIGIWIAFVGIGISMQMGQDLGPASPQAWDNAWDFIRTNTPETAIIGTWWDPGHMIATKAERRNFADGAHCGRDNCLYTINERITDLGKIMASNSEEESLQLISKYKGTSEKVYWIASDDLVSKFRWLQYFGTGCDGTSDRSCPLYISLGMADIAYSEEGLPAIVYYTDSRGSINTLVFFGEVPFPLLVQGRDAIMFKEMMYYEGGVVKTYDFENLDEGKREALRPFVEQLDLRLSNETVPFTAWVPMNYGYMVLIPEHQRNTVFTRMFFMEGQGLEHFKQVFRNENVKIYEVIF